MPGLEVLVLQAVLDAVEGCEEMGSRDQVRHACVGEMGEVG